MNVKINTNTLGNGNNLASWLSVVQYASLFALKTDIEILVHLVSDCLFACQVTIDSEMPFQ